MRAERSFQICIAGIAGIAIPLQVAAVTAESWRGQLWGVHLLAFLPWWFAALSWAAAAAAMALLFVPRDATRFDAALTKLGRGAEPRAAPLLFAAVCGIVFWLLRSRQSVLGDASQLWSEDFPKQVWHPREPLSALAHHLLYRITSHSLGPSGSHSAAAVRAVGIGSVLAGILFVLTAWGLGRWLAREKEPGPRRQGSVAVLSTLVLLSQGYGMLFFGYLESYALYASFVGLYLLASLLHLRGRLPLLVPNLLFLTLVAVHFSAIVLAPTLLLLIGRAVASGRSRRSAVRDLALGLLAGMVLDRALASASQGISLWQGITNILREGAGGGHRLAYLISVAHWRDFLNEQYLIGPLAAFLFVPATLIAARRGGLGDPAGVFLALSGVLVLGADWLTPEPALGYARDWDVFAPGGIVLTVGGLHALVTRVQPVLRPRLLACGFVVSVVHLAAWVAVNQSEPRSMERFATLPLGLGRNEAVIGNWHLRNGRTEEAIVWFEKALQTYPNNSNASGFLGSIYAGRGDFQRAAWHFERAVMARPDRVQDRHNLVRALERIGQGERALPHYEVLCRMEPDRVENWLDWASTLFRLGRAPGATAVLEAALPRFAAAQRRQPSAFRTNGDLGLLLAELDRPEAALPYFQNALRAEPASEMALYNVGSCLMRLGRAEEARPYLQRFLEVRPDHPRKDEVRAWLAGSTKPGAP